MACACGRGDLAQQAAGDDRAGNQRAAPGSGHGVTGSEDVGAEERARFIAGQHPPRALDQGPDRAAISVRIESDGQVGVDVIGEVQQEIGSSGFFRVGEGRSREVGVRVLLFGHHNNIRETGPTQGFDREFATHTVHGGQRDLEIAAPRAEARPEAGQVPLGVRVGAGVRVHRETGDRACGAGVADELLDLVVGGRDQLGATVEVHLVSVVGGRVV